VPKRVVVFAPQLHREPKHLITRPRSPGRLSWQRSISWSNFN